MFKKVLAVFSLIVSVKAGIHDGISLSHGSTYATFSHNAAPPHSYVEPTPQNNFIAPVIPAPGIAIHSSSMQHEGPYDPHPKYSYKYGVNDHHTGDHKTAEEERDGDIVRGSYTLLQPDGVSRTVKYTADHKNGFNPVVEYNGKARHPAPTYHGDHVAAPVHHVPVSVHHAPIQTATAVHTEPVQTLSATPLHNTIALHHAPIETPTIVQHTPVYASTAFHITPYQTPILAPQLSTYVSNSILHVPTHTMSTAKNDLTFAASTAQQTPIRTALGVQSIQNNVASTSPVTFAPAPATQQPKQQSIRHTG